MDEQQRFELLSTYIDRELSPEETAKVEQWLREDQQARQAYQSLSKLRYRLRETPAPPSQTSSEVLSERVIRRANHQGLMQTMLWSGSTIAAIFVTAVTGIWSFKGSVMPRFAQSEQVNSSSLTIAVNQPVLEIPALSETTATDEASSSSPNP